MAFEPMYLNRDLSWLDFNERVLAQAEDERLPLLERVKFCAIFSSNLDEFFMKRVGLAKRRLAAAGPDHPVAGGLTVGQLLERVRARAIELQDRQARCWLESLAPALDRAGVHILRYDDLSEARRAAVDAWFHANVFPVLTPLAVDPSHRFPFISNLSENFGLLLQRADGGEQAVFARVKVPSVTMRFVPVPNEAADPQEAAPAGPRVGENGVAIDPESYTGANASAPEFTFVELDDLLGHNLERLFPGMVIKEIAPFRVTRSAAVAEDDDEDVDDVLQQVEAELRRRRFASAVRLEAPPGASDRVLQFVTTQLGLDESDIYFRRGVLEYADLYRIVGLPRPDLREKPWTPQKPPALRNLRPLGRDEEEDEDLIRGVAASGPDAGATRGGESIFECIRRGDILVHHPYESFEHSVERFIAEAAEDPAVLAIKQTIYRTSPDSPFVRSLIRAAGEGKNVACLVELRARFDEERNVAFARQLEHAGVHVAYGVTGLKAHCKLSLVVRQERAGGAPPGQVLDGQDVAGPPQEMLRSYAHIGTGNYHPKTAQLYTDLGLLTADPDLTDDVIKVFNTLTGHASEQTYNRLLVAPHQMRTRFLDMIDREIEAAREGRPARVVCKMNQLEDRQITARLYEASQAGVPITLFVRGFCCLLPGVDGLSENIRVISVVGRFLEHARIFHFAAGSPDPTEGEFYMGSADWMYRNLSDRVEAITPVSHPVGKARLWRVMEVMERDRVHAWELQANGRWRRREPTGDDDGLLLGSPEREGTFSALMHDAVNA